MNHSIKGSLSILSGAFLISFSPVFVNLVDIEPTVSGFYRMLFGSIALFIIYLIKNYFKDLERNIIDISPEQMNNFAGNVIEVENGKGEPHIIMSHSAYKALDHKQLDSISSVANIIAIPLPTIERYGGGSARCMIAEIFLEKN